MSHTRPSDHAAPTETDSPAHAQSSPPTGEDRRGRSDLWGLFVLALPVVAYLWFIGRFSVNAVYQDQWSDVGLVEQWYAGHDNVASLWASHGDHRMVLPKLIALGLARSTHFNITFEEFLSAVMLMGSAALVIAAHRRRAPQTPLWWYLPVVLMLFSFVQFQNTLWGFQMAWYLVTLCLVASLFLLDRPVLSSGAVLAALALAIMASSSSLQGLIVWPSGLLLLYMRRRSNRILLLWCVVALVVSAVYFYHLHPSERSDQLFVFGHPFASFEFLLFLIGSVLGVQLTNAPAIEVLTGAVVVAVSAGLLVRYRHRDVTSSRPFGLALIVYGFLFAMTITEGRAWFGLWAPSRYTACGLLMLTGCYLVLIDRSTAPLRVPEESPESTERGATATPRPQTVTSVGTTVAWVGVLAVMAGVVVLGTGRGYVSAGQWARDQQLVADVTVNYRDATPALLSSELLPGNPAGVRELARALDVYGLSEFATAARSHYRATGLFPQFTAVRTRIILPRPGASVRGSSRIDAAATDPSGVRSVTFVVTSMSTGRSLTLGRASPSFYGWVLTWDTVGLPNGPYELTTTAVGAAGASARSTPVAVVVRN